MSTKNKEYTFEEALSRLEEIVKLLEAGEGTLESSISSFEEGIALVRYCTEALTGAEQTVKILLESGEEAPFASNETH